MQKPIEHLSASKLRTLLIEEVKSFIQSLETGTSEELQEQRTRLISIFNVLSEKENLEMAPLIWGRNSTKPASESSSHADLQPE
ncbi:MAG TPA: hypothetical protein VNW04_20370 [Puia sp.]|jgi:hypothetical protein|nr:hypothetical protein [Puia sp.]